MTGIYLPVASGTVSQANMKISAVDGGATASGGAFVDLTATTFGDVSTPIASGSVTLANTRIATVATGALLELVGVDLSTHIGKYIRLRSSGKRIEGFIGAAGGEALSGDLVTDGGFTSSANWIDVFGGVWTISDGKATANTADSNRCLRQVNLTSPLGKLYKTMFDVTDFTSGGVSPMVNVLDTGSAGVKRTGTGTNYTDYITARTDDANSGFYTQPSGGFVGSCDNLRAYQVTDLSTTGAKIYSTSALATQSWAYKDAGYNTNVSAGVTYEIYTPNPLPTKLGHLLKIKDSAGKVIQGFIKAAGTGETKQAAKTVVGITKANPGVLTLSAGHGYTNSMLVYFSGLTEMTSLNTKYKTLDGASGDTFTLGNLSSETAAETTGGACVEKLLTPSATGATIVSTKGGATYNFAQKDSAFNYNDPSGYTYEILKVLDAPVIATGTIAAGDSLMDTTTANAFAAPVGVDLSSYQDGRHAIAFYNSSGGYAAIARISSTAPSGESFTSIVVNGAFTTDTGWTKGTGWTIDAGDTNVATRDGTIGPSYLTQTATSRVSGASYLLGYDIVSRTAGTMAPLILTYQFSAQSAPATYSANHTYLSGDYTTYVGGADFAGSIDNVIVSRRDIPAATAVLLESSTGVRGYIYTHASFDPNLAMTYKVIYIGD